MRKHAATLILVLAAIVLGVWLWVDRDQVTEGERKRRENSVFSAWRREELARIEIAHEGETIVFERDPKKDTVWRMIAPIADKGDQAAIDRLTTTLEFAAVARKATEGGALGFENPRATGVIVMGGLKLRFVLGGPSPRPEGSSYFRVEGEPPIVVTKELTQALLEHSDTYRDRAVVPYLSVDLSRFEVKGEGGGFTLERLGARSFKVADHGVLAAREAVDKVWAALAEMRAESFANQAEAERLTAQPRFRIVMTPKDGSKQAAELLVGGECPGHPNDVVVLRKAPTVVAACAPKAALEPLGFPAAYFTELRPLPLKADEMEDVRIEWLAGADAGGGAAGDAGGAGGASGAGAAAPGAAAAPRVIEIARKGTGFHQREPVDRDLTPDEADAASGLLARIATSTALRFEKASGEPFTASARARARFGEEEHVVEVGPIQPDGRAWLRRQSDGARLEAPGAVVRRLVPRVTSLAPRRLLSETRRVTRVHLRCGAPQELVDSGEGFRLVEPAGFETDGSIVALIDALSRGNVDAWVSDSASPAELGLADESCKVVLGFEGGNAPITIRFGAEGEGGVYGQVEGSPHVFVAPKSLRRLASDLFVSRATIRVDPARLERVRVSVDGKPVPGVPLAAASSLVADRVVRAGKGAGTVEVGRPQIVIELVLAEGGPPKRVVCGAVLSDRLDKRRLCAVEGVQVTFEVLASRLAKLTGEALDAGAAHGGDGGVDAGAAGVADAEVARDGGAR